jgi:hypothetical protein
MLPYDTNKTSQNTSSAFASSLTPEKVVGTPKYKFQLHVYVLVALLLFLDSLVTINTSKLKRIHSLSETKESYMSNWKVEFKYSTITSTIRLFNYRFKYSSIQLFGSTEGEAENTEGDMSDGEGRTFQWSNSEVEVKN